MDLVGRKLSRRGNGKKAALFIATGGNIEAIASIPDVRAEPHPTTPTPCASRPEPPAADGGALRDVAEKQDGAVRAAGGPGRRHPPACFVYHRIAELNGSEEISSPG